MKNKSVATIKIFVISLLYLLLLIINVTGQTLEAEPVEYKSLVFEEIPGTYTIYRLSEKKGISYIGLCTIGGNELAIRYYNKETGLELLVLETFYTQKDIQNPSRMHAVEGSVELIRGDLSNPESSFVLPMVLGWVDEWLVSKHEFDSAPEYRTGESNSHLFQFWIPLIQLRSVSQTPFGDVSLVTVGVTSSGIDPVFFEWKGNLDPGIKKTDKITESSAIIPGKPKTISIDTLEFVLDSNWKQDADGFWNLSLSGKEVALLIVDRLDMNQFKDTDVFDLMKLYILGSGGNFIADGLSIFAQDDLPCLLFRVQNTETGQISIQYRIFLSRDEQFLSVIALEVDEEIYDKNKEYFDSIIF